MALFQDFWSWPNTCTRSFTKRIHANAVQIRSNIKLYRPRTPWVQNILCINVHHYQNDQDCNYMKISTEKNASSFWPKRRSRERSRESKTINIILYILCSLISRCCHCRCRRFRRSRCCFSHTLSRLNEKEKEKKINYIK